jgi:hypothetical protein
LLCSDGAETRVRKKKNRQTDGQTMDLSVYKNIPRFASSQCCGLKGKYNEVSYYFDILVMVQLVCGSFSRIIRVAVQRVDWEAKS